MAIKRGTLRGHHWTHVTGNDRPDDATGLEHLIIFSYDELPDHQISNGTSRWVFNEYPVASDAEIEAIVPGSDYKVVYARNMRENTAQRLSEIYPIPEDIEGRYVVTPFRKVDLEAWTLDRKGLRVCKKTVLRRDIPVYEALEDAYTWARRHAPKMTKDEKPVMQTSPLVNYLLASVDEKVRDRIAKEFQGWSDDPRLAGDNQSLTISGAYFTGRDIVEVTFSKPRTADTVLASIKTVSTQITTTVTMIKVETPGELAESTIAGLKGADLGTIIDEPWAHGICIQVAKQKRQRNAQGEEKHLLLITARQAQEDLALPAGQVTIDHEKKYRHVMTSIIERNLLLREDIVNLIEASNTEQRCVLACAMAAMKTGIDYVTESGLRGWAIKLEADTFSIDMAPLLTSNDETRRRLGLNKG